MDLLIAILIVGALCVLGLISDKIEMHQSVEKDYIFERTYKVQVLHGVNEIESFTFTGTRKQMDASIATFEKLGYIVRVR